MKIHYLKNIFDFFPKFFIGYKNYTGCMFLQDPGFYFFVNIFWIFDIKKMSNSFKLISSPSNYSQLLEI